VVLDRGPADIEWQNCPVDDDRVGCLALQSTLKPDRHTISTAYDAISGFTLLMRERPDLLTIRTMPPAAPVAPRLGARPPDARQPRGGRSNAISYGVAFLPSF
jgi:hypothetical protein